jgi:AAA family ATP:ADP antiporter
MQGFSRSERFLSLFTALRPGEGRGAILLCLQSFVLLFAYYLLKVIREPMILSEGSAEIKAYSSAAQALLLMAIVPGFARLYQRLAREPEKYHLLFRTLLFFVSNLLLFAAGYAAGIPVAIAFFIWLGIFSVMILALFWAFAADLYNVKSGQRIFPLIAAASALGALLGAAAAKRLDLMLGHDGVMLCAALLLGLPLWLCRRVEPVIPRESACPGSAEEQRDIYPLMEGFRLVLRRRYLTLIAAFVILLNLINTNGGYILASLVRDAALLETGIETPPGEAFITGFYSEYLFYTTLFGFLIQLFLVSRIYKWLGIRGALLMLPLLMMASYSLLAVFPLLAVARPALIAENSVNDSLESTTRHALFLPVDRKSKYVGKHTIDTFFFRIGDVLSGSLVYLGSAVIGFGIAAFIATNLGLACLLLSLSWAIGRRHLRAARETLGNLPPIAMTPLDDLRIKAGETTELELAADTFVDPDVGDALKYQAFAIHSARLPSWARFDSLSRRFEFRPPAHSTGSLRIRVVARDFEGLEAELSFNVYYGD